MDDGGERERHQETVRKLGESVQKLANLCVADRFQSTYGNGGAVPVLSREMAFFQGLRRMSRRLVTS